MTERRKRDDLQALLRKACVEFDALPPHEQAEIRRQQRQSWVRAERSWPTPKYKWVDGVKVYDSYEDYCND